MASQSLTFRKPPLSQSFGSFRHMSLSIRHALPIKSQLGHPWRQQATSLVTIQETRSAGSD